MTVTLGQIVVAEQALTALNTVQLPIKTAYSLSKLTRLIAPELKHWSDQRNAFIKELGTIQPDESVSITPGTPTFVTFATRLDELATVDVELEWRPIVLSELGNIQMSSMDLAKLHPFIVEG